MMGNPQTLNGIYLFVPAACQRSGFACCAHPPCAISLCTPWPLSSRSKRHPAPNFSRVALPGELDVGEEGIEDLSAPRAGKQDTAGAAPRQAQPQGGRGLRALARPSGDLRQILLAGIDTPTAFEQIHEGTQCL